MNMHRVSTIDGELPLLVVAPHGSDDARTDIITEVIAKEIDAYAVINHGWKRAQKVDIWKDHANCNHIPHLFEDVVKEEFLDPITRYVNKIEREYGFVLMLIVHGVGNYIRTLANDPSLDMIIGYGAGNPASYSCEPRLKDALIYYLHKEGITAYEGTAGSKFAGRAKNNLNQFFRRWKPRNLVQSIQVEIVHELRENAEICELTGQTIASVVDDMLLIDDATDISYIPKKF